MTLESKIVLGVCYKIVAKSKFNEVYFINFQTWGVENIEFLVNFVVENSNRLHKTKFGRENELSVFTLVANNIGYVIYPWRKVVCFVLS